VIIRLNNIKIFGYHGCLPEEKKLGQNYELDVLLELKNKDKFKSDCLENTIDYVKVFELIKNEFQQKSYNLIESAAEVLADSLLAQYCLLKTVTVRIRKPHAPIEGHFSDIEIEVIKSN